MPSTFNRHQGFTLIEIMVVVTIIGILTGLIAVNVFTTNPQKEINREILRLKAVIELAQEEALFSQEEIGVVVDENKYRFVRWNTYQAQPEVEESVFANNDGNDEPPIEIVSNTSPTWQLITDETAFKERELGDEFEIILEVDQENIDLTGGVDEKQREEAKDASDILTEDEEDLMPSVFIMSSGEISPFVLEIYEIGNSDVTEKLSADETGRLWIGDEEDDEDK